MVRTPDPPLVRKLRELAARAPIAVAHRGDSENFPENTLPAFAAAVQLGVGMVEFDAQTCGDGTLVCIHDETLDRTTDAAAVLGPGRRVDQCSLGDLRRLDAGAWKGARHRGARVPTLAEGLRAIAPGAVPMIEHKTGAPERYVALLRELGLVGAAIVQSFDWDFVARVRALEPGIALGALGPGEAAKELSPEVLARIDGLGVHVVHWDEQELRAEHVAALHERRLLVCTYTTDDDMGLVGGAVLGIDAITTNRPGRLIELVRRGIARRKA